MLTIETTKLEISKELKNKIDIICRFENVKPIYENGSIQNIKNTNIAYVSPHIITINKIKYLFFNNSNDIFINNYNEKIKIKDLKAHIKQNK